MKRARVSKNLFIGDRDICDTDRRNHTHIIHIWRSDKPENSCKYQREININDNNNLILDYKDGEELPKETLKTISEFVKQIPIEESKILVHCAAGLTRSPTVGLFVLSEISGMHPLLLLDNIYHNIWVQYNVIANICRTPLKDIVKFEWRSYLDFHPDFDHGKICK